LLLIHDEPTCRRLGRLVATSPALGSADFLERYGRWFTGALARRPHPRRHLNALQHLAGYLRGVATPEDRASLAASIDDFAAGIVPLSVPLALLEHLMVRHDLCYPMSQLYRQPFPRELALTSRLFCKSNRKRAS
ncbi:MAG: YbgA family protein, partial [Planctomycetota bacterium]|nr:YbgA family protein [Planctomycetota bacterium]